VCFPNWFLWSICLRLEKYWWKNFLMRIVLKTGFIEHLSERKKLKHFLSDSFPSTLYTEQQTFWICLIKYAIKKKFKTIFFLVTCALAPEKTRQVSKTSEENIQTSSPETKLVFAFRAAVSFWKALLLDTKV